ncbi:MAG: cysteine hydrolase family protein [Planctomycetota bacterium]|jgi:nicotinamidase-related amidase
MYERKNTALIIIDMQNDAMSMVPSGKHIIPAIKRVLTYCRSSGIPVIHIVRVHRPNGIDVERFRFALFRKQPFLVDGSSGVEIVSELMPFAEEYIVRKSRFSGFFRTDLQTILARFAIRKLVICGIRTPNCIRSTAMDAVAYDYDVVLLENAIAAQTPQIHEADLFDMKNMGMAVITVDEFLTTYSQE